MENCGSVGHNTSEQMYDQDHLAEAAQVNFYMIR